MSAAQAAELQGAPAQLVKNLAQGKVFEPRDTEVETLTTAGEAWEAREASGRALREHNPRETHGDWKPAPHRPDPMKLIKASNQGRVPELVALRMERMASSPFAFLRGAAVVMAWDLAQTKTMGLDVVIDGDCHIDNFGLSGTAQDEVVLDLNDFDETTIGPWEYDLKRLTASINLSGRENGLSRKERKKAVMAAVNGYRFSLNRLQSLPVLELWNRHTVPERMDERQMKLDKKSAAIIRKSVAKARATNNATFLETAAERDQNGKWHIKLDAPVTTAVEPALKTKIIAALHDYIETLAPERQYMIRRYHVVDIVRRVVGVGSVGLRAYLIMLIGNGDDDGLFLQLKEAAPPALAPYLPVLPKSYKHEGQRVVYGQRLLQAAGDPLLGWTTMEDRPYYVRQMKNFKGAIPTEFLYGQPFNFFAFGYGALLARAHARVGDAAVISGYCGASDTLDVAMASWAEAYADQTEIDHKNFVKRLSKNRDAAEKAG
ncbi:MAG: hypothetical protein B7Z75_02800 [Acidocella sp. 20-57-95]|nr:MAG: hypothetical protein B7Z75_02800 [Acidocella sp. 20-57-95]